MRWQTSQMQLRTAKRYGAIRCPHNRLGRQRTRAASSIFLDWLYLRCSSQLECDRNAERTIPPCTQHASSKQINQYQNACMHSVTCMKNSFTHRTAHRNSMRSSMRMVQSSTRQA